MGVGERSVNIGKPRSGTSQVQVSGRATKPPGLGTSPVMHVYGRPGRGSEERARKRERERGREEREERVDGVERVERE